MPRAVLILWAVVALVAVVSFLGRGWRLEAERAQDYAEVIAHCANRNAGFTVGDVAVLCYPTRVQ